MRCVYRHPHWAISDAYNTTANFIAFLQSLIFVYTLHPQFNIETNILNLRHKWQTKSNPVLHQLIRHPLSFPAKKINFNKRVLLIWINLLSSHSPRRRHHLRRRRRHGYAMSAAPLKRRYVEADRPGRQRFATPAACA